MTARGLAANRVSAGRRAANPASAARRPQAAPAACARASKLRARAASPSTAAETGGAPVWPGNVRKIDYNKTYYPKKADTDPQRKVWYVIDAEGKTLGRLACLAANYLRGKHLPTFSNSMDVGGYVVVVNADKVAVTGRKATDKMYYYHRVHRPGTMEVESFAELKDRIPERIIERAVRGMLPKGRHGRHLFTHLKVYASDEHPHEAQKPVDITALIDKKPKDADLTAIREAVGMKT